MLKFPEQYRIDGEAGFCGAFLVKFQGRALRVIASNEMDWDHVSVSKPKNCPSWEEMNFIKDLFFEPSDCVIQYHPPKSDYVNWHPYSLHLWRPHNEVIPMPPWIMV